MARKRILYVCHNHPSVRPGGAEAYAHELYTAMRSSPDFEPYFLAKGGPPVSTVGNQHPGTYFAPVGNDANEYFFYTDGYDYDWLHGTIRGKDIYTKHLNQFLLGINPDIVHVQHTMHLGYDLLRQIKTTLPHVPIVYTLHELLPICHRQGQMVRTVNNEELCDLETPRRCHECFPGISPQSFYMRKRFIQSHLAVVDLFIAPSRFLLERFVSWGIPRDKIRLEEYGRMPTPPEAVEDDEPRSARNRFGFFGQLTPFKGVHVLLQAMKLLADAATLRQDISARWDHWPEPAPDTEQAVETPHLWVHGANLDIQQGTFQNEIRNLLEATSDMVTLVGRYDHRDLPRLMKNVDWVVVPSLWWENSPLVIQEAFMHGRPVICSDIGGMAEKVSHDINGLHFRVGDPENLARTLQRVAESPELWERLREGISRIYPMDEHVRELTGIYQSLSAQYAGIR